MKLKTILTPVIAILMVSLLTIPMNSQARSRFRSSSHRHFSPSRSHSSFSRSSHSNFRPSSHKSYFNRSTTTPTNGNRVLRRTTTTTTRRPGMNSRSSRGSFGGNRTYGSGLTHGLLGGVAGGYLLGSMFHHGGGYYGGGGGYGGGGYGGGSYGGGGYGGGYRSGIMNTGIGLPDIILLGIVVFLLYKFVFKKRMSNNPRNTDSNTSLFGGGSGRSRYNDDYDDDDDEVTTTTTVVEEYIDAPNGTNIAKNTVGDAEECKTCDYKDSEGDEYAKYCGQCENSPDFVPCTSCENFNVPNNQYCPDCDYKHHLEKLRATNP